MNLYSSDPSGIKNFTQLEVMTAQQLYHFRFNIVITVSAKPMGNKIIIYKTTGPSFFLPLITAYFSGSPELCRE